MGLLALLSRSAAENYEPFAIAAAMGCTLAVLAASPFDATDVSFLARCRAWEHRLCIAASGLSIGSDFKKSLDLRGGIYVPFETGRKQTAPRLPMKETPCFTRVLHRASIRRAG
jgi:hypothetical protein